MRTSWVVNSDPYPVFVQVGILDSIWELKKKEEELRLFFLSESNVLLLSPDNPKKIFL